MCLNCRNICFKKSKCWKCESDRTHIECSAYYRFVESADKTETDITFFGTHTCMVTDDDQNNDKKLFNYVDKVPYNIDGDVVYHIKSPNKRRVYDSVVDGRSWGPSIPLKSPKKTKKYSRKCRGGFICENADCSFVKQFGKPNNCQFETDGNLILCRECGQKTKENLCEAKKTYTISSEEDLIVLKHEGHHTCPIVKCDSVPTDEVKEIMHLFPSAKPAEIKNAIIKKAVFSGASEEDLAKVIDPFLDHKKLVNTKQNIKHEIRPHGTSIAAVNDVKSKMPDKYFIYYTSDKPVRVLTTSEERLQIAKEIHKENQEEWATLAPYCHVDFQASRVVGLKTFGCNIYHPNLLKVVNLFKFYCEEETATEVAFALDTFSKAVEDYTQGEIDDFKPDGWMSDESGAILKGLERKYGPEVLDQIVTCIAHYQFSVQRNVRNLDNEEGKKFNDLAAELQQVTSIAQYEETKANIKKFAATSSKPEKIEHWINWWDVRRTHWAAAWRPTNNAPLSNLSEVAHASEKARGSVNIQLLDAVMDDITASQIFKRERVHYKTGVYKGGSGPSSIELNIRAELSQRKRAAEFSIDDEHSRVRQGGDFSVDESSSHREDIISVNGKPVKKRKIGNERPKRTRAKVSASFKITLEKAKQQSKYYDIVEDEREDPNSKYRSFVLMQSEFKSSFDDNSVRIDDHPSCSCAFFKERELRNKQV